MSKVEVKSKSEETINDVEATQGDKLEDEDNEQMEDKVIVAMAAINTKRADEMMMHTFQRTQWVQ